MARSQSPFAKSAAFCTRATIPCPASSATIVASGDPFLGANAITEARVSSVWTRITGPFPQAQRCQMESTQCGGLFFQESTKHARRHFPDDPAYDFASRLEAPRMPHSAEAGSAHLSRSSGRFTPRRSCRCSSAIPPAQPSRLRRHAGGIGTGPALTMVARTIGRTCSGNAVTKARAGETRERPRPTSRARYAQQPPI
jgi:hypothetical protein